MAERIRLRIQAVVLEPPGEATEPVTLSASVGGVFYSPDDAASLDELILIADSALYEAKNSGRNTVRLRTTGSSRPAAHDLGSGLPPDSNMIAERDLEVARRQDTD